MSDQILGLGKLGGQIVDRIMNVRPDACVHAVDTDVDRLMKLRNVLPGNRWVALGSKKNGNSKYCNLELNKPSVHGLKYFTADLVTLVAGADNGALFATECIMRDEHSCRWGKDRKYIIAIPAETKLPKNNIAKQIENFLKHNSKITIIKVKDVRAPLEDSVYQEVAQNVIKLHYGLMG